MTRYAKTMSQAIEEMQELQLERMGYSPKEIKMAIGIASDPRYKQGNYSGAVKQIEKIKKGLSTHKQVAAVLKRQNENLEEQKVGGYDVDNDILVRKGNKYHKTVDNLFKSKSDAQKFAKEFDGFVIPQAGGRFIVGLNKVTEEVELEEKYDLYHKSFSDAMQHAYDYAQKKLGITVDKSEIDRKVATGPKKPTEGKTNKYRLKGKGGNLQIQVYNKGGSKPFELNMYKEEFESDLDENKVEVGLKEGTWAMADEKGDVDKLKKLMSKKFKLGKEGDDATNQLYRLLGDDELFDSLYVAGNKNPNGDARPVIINWFKDRIKSNAYNTGADAKDLAKKIGLKKLGESIEIGEAKFQVNYSKGGKLFSKTVNAKNEDDAEDKAIKQFKIEDDDIRSVVKEASARADAMRAMGRGRKVDPADIDEPKASDTDKKSAMKNMIMQMRQSLDSKGSKPIEFEDGKSQKVDPKILTLLTRAHDKIQKPRDKENFVKMISKSYRDMLKISKMVGKQLRMGESIELDEAIVQKYVLINMHGKVQAYASEKSDALEIARRTKSTMHPIKKKVTDKTLEKMNALQKTPKELKDLGIIEGVEMNELKMNDPKLNKIFDKLKPKSTVQIKKSSSIGKDQDFSTYLVVSKNTLRNGTEKITLKNRANPTGVKSFLYRRDGKVTFAIGDMGASIDDIKESVNEAKFSDDMINKLKKAYEPMKGKKINPTPLMKIFDKIDSNKDGLEQLYKADIPFVSMMAMSRLMLKHNYKAADINKLGKIRREEFKESEMTEKLTDGNLSLKDTVIQMWKEAVSPEQQAAIAISKKEKGEKPKKENNFIFAAKMAKKNGEKTFTIGGKEYDVEEALNSETNKNDKSDDGDGLDAVQPKAVKKKFADRKDKDIDNDGDVDDSDKFLHKRRKAVSKAINSQKENVELDEVLKGFKVEFGKGNDAGIAVYKDKKDAEAYAKRAPKPVKITQVTVKNANMFDDPEPTRKEEFSTVEYERYLETKKGSLRDSILKVWGEDAHSDDEDTKKKDLTKSKKDGTKKMTDTGKEITPVDMSPKMPKVKNERNRV